MDHAAYFSRYHAGPDIDDSELVPLPDSAEERAKLLAEFQGDRARYAPHGDSIEEWCADCAYDNSVVEWLRTQA